MTFLSDWITERGKVLRIYNLGPVFLDNVTSRQLNEQIEEARFSADMTTIFRDMIWELPMVPLSRFLEYGIMLHRAVTGEKITVSDIIFTEADTSVLRKNHREPEQADSRGAYLAEARFLKLVEEGNLHYKAAKARLLAFGNSVRYASGDYLRQAKNAVIVFTVLCSRAAIRGGLDADTAFLLNDRYIQAVEVAESLDEIREAQETMLEDFIRRVYRLRTREGVSPQIMGTCDYISTHLEDALSIHALAARLGYTDYYFSNKFKKEIGMTVRDYITRQKMERAKELLSGTNMDILSICLALGYSSQSHFGDLFRKATGMSPGEYRSRYRT